MNYDAKDRPPAESVGWVLAAISGEPAVSSPENCRSGHDDIADIKIGRHADTGRSKGGKMSVDFYVAMPAGEWPEAAAVEQCLRTRQYPVQLKRFPHYNPKVVNSEGILATVDGQADAYLEGELFPANLAVKDVNGINDRIASTGGSFKIGSTDVVISMRVRSPSEVRAASYLISSLIVCFHGYGFEPQGNTHGRDDFSRSLISQADALNGL